MKRDVLTYLSVAAISAITSVATIAVTSNSKVEQNPQPVTAISDQPFTTTQATDTEFTSAAVRENYPDLTYAAESAVKAVVNIRATVTVDRGGYMQDPFYEFFGYPQGGMQREAEAGGSGVII
jgi:S1-C subfamily serine protease